MWHKTVPKVAHIRGCMQREIERRREAICKSRSKERKNRMVSYGTSVRLWG